MSISFECEGCSKPYTVPERFAGKMARCKQCGQRMTIPSESDSESYGLDAPEAEPAPLPPRMPSAARRPLFDPADSSPRESSSGLMRNGIGGAFGVLIVVAGIGLRVYSRWDRAQARNARNPQANAFAPADAGGHFAPPPARDFAADPSGPIRLPNFPDPGPGREIEPGVMLHEVVLGSDRPPLGSPPGHSGKLWLYLPSGDHPARSLPCILIAGAGGTLMCGMKLADGDVPEHLPYVRAGSAVLAYELDGALDDHQEPGPRAVVEAATRFLAARAGLVNAHIALEFLLARVPQVDPSRLTAAGHSSAGTMALLFAEDEPRLASCIAYAPAADVESHFRRFNPPGLMPALDQAGLADLYRRHSPRTGEARLDRPLFLFYARDEPMAPDIEAFAARMKAAGKPITVESVPTGGHHEPMIREGIPRAIAWLNEQGARPAR